MLDSHQQEILALMGETSALSYTYEDLLPIETFKHSDNLEKHFVGQELAKTFRSSGTTGEHRSHSFFSEKGIDLYRSGASLFFRQFMKSRVAQELDYFSLIPPSKEAPDSSLSQMLSWFGAFLPISFLETLPANFDKPALVFGTGFHFVNLFDSGYETQLPGGSLIFETGGTKGRSRSVDNVEYEMILCETFGVEPEQIVSEYGMAELATQAYGFWPEKKFRFPSWVKTWVCPGYGSLKNSGRGSLVVYDPLRIDFPKPIRTQDLVELDTDGSFSLLGRVNSAPLKGCSLNFEVKVSKQDFSATSLSKGTFNPSFNGIRKRIPNLKKFLHEYFANPRELIDEIGSENATDHVLTELRQSLPREAEDWFKAAIESNPEYASWLIICPNNHSIAPLYPLSFGYLLGLKLRVRIPKHLKYLERFVQNLSSLPGAQIEILNAEYRVEDAGTLDGIEAIFAFGESATVEQIEKQTGLPTCKYGTKISLISGPIDELLRNSDQIIKEAFSLGQKGCMSTRAILTSLSSEEEIDSLVQKLGESFTKFWQKPLTTRESCALEYERVRYRQLNVDCSQANWNQPLFPIVKIGFDEKFLATAPFCLPIIVSSQKPDENTVFSIYRATKKEAAPWNGSLWGKPLYQIDL